MIKQKQFITIICLIFVQIILGYISWFSIFIPIPIIMCTVLWYDGDEPKTTITCITTKAIMQRKNSPKGQFQIIPFNQLALIDSPTTYQDSLIHKIDDLNEIPKKSFEISCISNVDFGPHLKISVKDEGKQVYSLLWILKLQNINKDNKFINAARSNNLEWRKRPKILKTIFIYFYKVAAIFGTILGPFLYLIFVGTDFFTEDLSFWDSISVILAFLIPVLIVAFILLVLSYFGSEEYKFMKDNRKLHYEITKDELSVLNPVDINRKICLSEIANIEIEYPRNFEQMATVALKISDFHKNELYLKYFPILKSDLAFMIEYFLMKIAPLESLETEFILNNYIKPKIEGATLKNFIYKEKFKNYKVLGQKKSHNKSNQQWNKKLNLKSEENVEYMQEPFKNFRPSWTKFQFINAILYPLILIFSPFAVLAMMRLHIYYESLYYKHPDYNLALAGSIAYPILFVLLHIIAGCFFLYAIYKRIKFIRYKNTLLFFTQERIIKVIKSLGFLEKTSIELSRIKQVIHSKTHFQNDHQVGDIEIWLGRIKNKEEDVGAGYKIETERPSETFELITYLLFIKNE